MGIFDSLLTKIITKEEEERIEKEKGKKGSKKTKSTISEDEKLLAKELASKIAELERKDGAFEEREKLIKAKEEELAKAKIEIDEIRKKEVEKLEKISALTKQDAKDLILAATEKRIAEDLAKKIKEGEEEVKAQVDEKSKEILIDAIQHGVTDWVSEYTVSTLHLPDEDMKGRIIGREGRNIRTFERATGVEIEIDETNDIRLSSFDSVRREIARRSIEKLIKDRRIQPSRIEEIIEKTKQEVEKIMFEEGEKLCHAVQVYRLDRELIQLLGRFKFRFSYGQNMILHTLEETKIGIQLAYEVGANVNTVRLGCLLHDIGKIVTEEEGTHIQLGIDLARKYRIPEEVVACIAEHHEDKPFSSPESRVVWIADAASGSRPGARYEPHGEYVERMTQIEQIAREFPEAQEAFAYQAGRDVRVLVKPDKVSDDELVVLASKITKALEEKASYAGQIKVTCIRETRVSEVTKSK